VSHYYPLSITIHKFRKLPQSYAISPLLANFVIAGLSYVSESGKIQIDRPFVTAPRRTRGGGFVPLPSVGLIN
jgi:hypothetical protein